MKKNFRRIIFISIVLVVATASAYLLFVRNSSYTVTFYSDNNIVLKTDRVRRNASATPPISPQTSLGSIFSHWDVSFTSIKNDLDVHAVSTPIPKTPNVFALSGASVKSGDDVHVPLLLSGKVCLCSFDIEVSYNPKELKFADITDADSALVFGNDEEKGIIHINYISTENTFGDVDLGLLKFNTLASNSVNSNISVKVIEINAYDYGYDFYSPESSAIDAVVSTFA